MSPDQKAWLTRVLERQRQELVECDTGTLATCTDIACPDWDKTPTAYRWKHYHWITDATPTGGQ